MTQGNRTSSARAAPTGTGPVTSSVRFTRPRPTPEGPTNGAPPRNGGSGSVRTRAPAGSARPARTTEATKGSPERRNDTASTLAAIVRRPRRDPVELLPPPASPRTAFRQRYGVVYDTQGPRVRLGILWAAAVALALAVRPLRPYGLATLYAVVAGVAAMQVVDAWHAVRSGADRWVAALGASTLPILATLGVGPVGGGLVVLVVAALGVAAARQDRQMSVVAAAGHTVLSAGLCGMAAASMVLLADYEIGAVIILVVLVMVYDASDYLVGSGADNGFEGPVAGAMFMAAVTWFVVVAGFPPFRGADIWTFAVLAAVACPAGQLLASAMLPNGAVRAPALRRLDSWLIVAPAWAALVGLYLQRAA